MKFTRGNSAAISFAAISLVLMTLVATTTTTITSMPIARAQVQSPPPGVSTGPPTFLGNPNDLSTGPPVPNCNAIFQGNFHGPPDDTRLGCK
jgi:hypothetical protein